MEDVDLYANGALVQRVPVYPFQFRYTPPASAVGTSVKLTAEAVDKAGNKSTRDLHAQRRSSATTRPLVAGAGRRRRRWSARRPSARR